MRWYFSILDACIALVLFFIGFAIFRSDGKAARYIAGYNTKSDPERLQYDEPRLCADYGRRIMLFSLPFFLGAIIDFFFPLLGLCTEAVLFTALLLWHIVDIKKHAESRYKKTENHQ